MATVVCRGLRSWPCPPSSQRMHDTTPSDMGSWNFLEAVSAKDGGDNGGRGPAQRRDGVYIHPLVVVPKPSLRLSQKSLELCTENLGNETGSDVSDNESTEPGVFSSTEEERPSKTLHGRQRRGENLASAGFPPPLMTIRETGDLRYKTRREQGRLVLEAVRTSSANTVFRAERSQGRLTLSFASEPAHIYCHFEEGSSQKHRNPESVEETEGDEEDNVEAVEGCSMFKRPSGCKDSDHRIQQENRGMSNWETFWVAT